jgi:hypothetical protein
MSNQKRYAHAMAAGNNRIAIQNAPVSNVGQNMGFKATMTGYAYTEKEDAILKEWYEKEGLPGAMVKLQLAGFLRTSDSVRRRASILRLKSPYCSANFGPGPYRPDPKFDAAYDKVNRLISEGVKVADALRIAGIERSRYYRTRKVREGV